MSLLPVDATRSQNCSLGQTKMGLTDEFQQECDDDVGSKCLGRVRHGRGISVPGHREEIEHVRDAD